MERFGYDNLDRETGASWDNDATPAVAKSYDDAGRLMTVVNDVSAISYTYDEANRVLSETTQISADSGPKTVSYTYDADGNRRTLGYPSGSSVDFDYTNRNQLKSVVSGTVSAVYAYDLAGNQHNKTLGNGTTATFDYDDANRLLTLDNLNANSSLAKYDYGYNNANIRTGRTETISGASKTDIYGYDAIDQLTTVRYNAVGTTQDRGVAYNYDGAGNRVGANGITDSAAGSTPHAVNALNQYTAVGALTPTYDPNGNMISQDGWSYTYDAMNRITSAYASGVSVTFAYDGQNRCVSRTTNGTVMFFYYDRWRLLEEQDNTSALIAKYVNEAGTDEIIARVAGTGPSYYQQDALGNVTALTDASGNVTERYSYDVFGAPTFKDGSGNVLANSASGNRFLSTGREYIFQAKLYDYRNRIYFPTFGRFMQIDPVRFHHSDANPYRYVRNRATVFRDPFGLWPGLVKYNFCLATISFNQCREGCSSSVTGECRSFVDDDPDASTAHSTAINNAVSAAKARPPECPSKGDMEVKCDPITEGVGPHV